MTGPAGIHRGRFRIRTRKIKPELMTVTKRNAQGDKEKKKVWGKSFIDCIFFSPYWIDRSRPVDEQNHYVPAGESEQNQVHTFVGNWLCTFIDN